MFDAIKDGVKKRALKTQEIIFARYVFRDSLPYDKIYISNTIGLGNRDFTTPALRKKKGWVLHMGIKGYANAVNPVDERWVFIHELVHVWQSIYYKHRWGYVGDSICQQVILLKGSKAYNYELGKKWSEYHAEQQAQIISDWYQLGAMESDPQFEYVKNNIRPGIN